MKTIEMNEFNLGDVVELEFWGKRISGVVLEIGYYTRRPVVIRRLDTGCFQGKKMRILPTSVLKKVSRPAT